MSYARSEAPSSAAVSRRATAGVSPSLHGPDTLADARSAGWDRRIAELAASQHGVVARLQLRDLGLSDRSIRLRVRSGRLHEVHTGVYAVGHRLLSERGWWMAAVLAGGPGALLSHRAAAALWGLVDRGPATVDVVVLRNRRAEPGLRPRRVRSIADADRATVDGIPCTAVPRTLVDLAAVSDERALDRAVRRAEELRLFDRVAIEVVLRTPRPGVRALRETIEVFAEDARARRNVKAELERRFLHLLRRHGFVLPQINVGVQTPWRSWEVDALWPSERIVVELDGWSTHRDRESFRRDHRRDADLRAAGYAVTRLSWEQVVDDERGTVERLVRTLPRVASSSRR